MSYDWHRRFHAAMIDIYERVEPIDFALFSRLLDEMYHRGRALPDNDKAIARMLNVHVFTWRAAKKRLEACGALVFRDGQIDNDEAMKARWERNDTSMKRSLAGHRGGIASAKSR